MGHCSLQLYEGIANVMKHAIISHVCGKNSAGLEEYMSVHEYVCTCTVELASLHK